MTPARLALQVTLDFLVEALPAKARLLEVGCGRGDLSALLAGLDHEVVALDRDEDFSPLAVAAGVEVRSCDFLDFSAEPFDVLIFSRSLHHIHPLAAAVEKADSLLKPGGIVVAEELALERMDRRTALWLQAIRRLLAAGGFLSAVEGEGLLPEDPLAGWREQHRHDPPLSTGDQMSASLSARFSAVEPSRGPYLFRYFCDGLPADAAGHRLAAEVLRIEETLMSEEIVQPIGLRLIASKAG